MDKFVVKTKRKRISEESESDTPIEGESGPANPILDTGVRETINEGPELSSSTTSSVVSGTCSVRCDFPDLADYRNKDLNDKDRLDIIHTKWTQAFDFKFPARYCISIIFYHFALILIYSKCEFENEH